MTPSPHRARKLLSPESRAELVRATPFGALDEESMTAMLRLFVSRRVTKGAVVFLEGAAGDRFFVVVEGKLKAFRHTPPARDVTVFTLAPGESFGFLPLLDGEPYPVSVAALEASELLVLLRSDFLRLTRSSPSFCTALLAHLARRLRGCLDQVEMLGRQGALARTAHGLLSLAKPSATGAASLTAALPSTQAEFAQLLHVTPENLSRALTRLRRDGVVERLGARRFRILNASRLQGLADGDA